MKCIRCNRNIRTTAEERNAFRGMGYYTPMYWVRDQGLDAKYIEAEGLDPDDSDHFLCFDCYGDLINKQREDFMKNYDGPIKIKGSFKESKKIKEMARTIDNYNEFHGWAQGTKIKAYDKFHFIMEKIDAEIEWGHQNKGAVARLNGLVFELNYSASKSYNYNIDVINEDEGTIQDQWQGKSFAEFLEDMEDLENKYSCKAAGNYPSEYCSFPSFLESEVPDCYIEDFKQWAADNYSIYEEEYDKKKMLYVWQDMYDEYEEEMGIGPYQESVKKSKKRIKENLGVPEMVSLVAFCGLMSASLMGFANATADLIMDSLEKAEEVGVESSKPSLIQRAKDCINKLKNKLTGKDELGLTEEELTSLTNSVITVMDDEYVGVVNSETLTWAVISQLKKDDPDLFRKITKELNATSDGIRLAKYNLNRNRVARDKANRSLKAKYGIKDLTKSSQYNIHSNLKVREARMNNDHMDVTRLLNEFLEILRDEGFRKVMVSKGSGKPQPFTFIVRDSSNYGTVVEISLEGKYDDEAIAMFDRCGFGISGDQLYQFTTYETFVDDGGEGNIWWVGKSKEEFEKDVRDFLNTLFSHRK